MRDVVLENKTRVILMYEKPYENILAFLTMNRCIGRNALLTYCGDRRKRDRFLQKAKKQKHIREKEIFIRKGNVKRSETVYTISRKGMYALGRPDGSSWWSQLIPEFGDSFQLFNSQEERQEGFSRLSKKTDVVVMADRAGAYIPLDTYVRVSARVKDESDLPDQTASPRDDITWPEFLRSNMSRESYEKHSYLVMNNQDERQPSFAVFHSAMEMKYTIVSSTTHINFEDIQRGRYTGIIDSHFKSLMLFSAPLFGMSWSAWIKSPETNAYSLWLKTKAVPTPAQQRKSGSTAALFVKNAGQFANLYHDIYNAQGSIDEKNNFGGDFEHFYIVPVSNEGVIQLKQLLFNSEPELLANITESAVTSLGYLRSSDQPQRKKCFSLTTPDGDEVAVGFMLDSKTMLQIEAAALAEPGRNFGVLCYEWQLPYYEKIMPSNVWYATYPNPKEA